MDIYLLPIFMNAEHSSKMNLQNYENKYNALEYRLDYFNFYHLFQFISERKCRMFALIFKLKEQFRTKCTKKIISGD